MQSAGSGAGNGVQGQIHQHTNSGHVASSTIWQNITMLDLSEQWEWKSDGLLHGRQRISCEG